MNRPALGVFLILWGSYAFFWQGRDWNVASRLMLTYALVDRGTVSIDGLDDQTGDKARYLNHYYSDKLPGYSVLAIPAYASAKVLLGLPDHPLARPGFSHWAADYWVTLFTSGLLTALTGAMLVGLAQDLGCGPRRAALIGLAYGLATPAFVYGTLGYGHGAAAACLLGSFRSLWRTPAGRSELPSVVAGFLAAYASVIELQVGPVSAVLGLYAVALALGGKRPFSSIFAFGLGALIPTMFLLAYNWVAFDSPFRMGYFFHATQRFAAVHSAGNPLGLGGPDWGRVDDLLIRPARGLFWYAPVVLLSIPGLIALLARRMIGMAIVCAATMVLVFLVNLSYPEWSGGWSTGPRLLVPLLPFAMLPIAGLLAIGGRGVTGLAGVLTALGLVIVMLFEGVGGRVPDPRPDVPPGYVDPMMNPLVDAVAPIWRGEPLPDWVFGRRFTRTVVSIARPEPISNLSPHRQWLQFTPLWVAQALAIACLFALKRPTPSRSESGPVDEPRPAKPDPESVPSYNQVDRNS